MSEEEKQIVLVELCARLPYGVKVQYAFDEGCGTHRWEIGILEGFYPKQTSIDGVDFILKIDAPYGTYHLHYEFWAIKPYLRPMSSMTEEEKELMKGSVICFNEIEGNSTLFDEIGLDWLNTHHFDYRGLIDKGLALEAPADMYK